MARGMNLDEFKNALSSEARVENEQLKAELEKLKKESSERIKKLEEELKINKDNVRALGNRCYVFTQGSMCLFCDVDGCEHALKWEEEYDLIKYMTKHNLPRDEKTLMELNNRLQKKRNAKKGTNKNAHKTKPGQTNFKPAGK